jgi:hypothetical protein
MYLAVAARPAKLCLSGGPVMLLPLAARPSKKDLDAIFPPAQVVRQAACALGEDGGLTPDWLNDAAKGFVSARHGTISGNLPQFAHPRLVMPAREYLPAMKCMAARLGLGGSASRRCARHHASDPPSATEKSERSPGQPGGLLSGEPHSGEGAMPGGRFVRPGKTMTPESLAEVAELDMQGESFDLALRNFLDAFYARPGAQARAAARAWSAGAIGPGERKDAHLAARRNAWRRNISCRHRL